jgi:hypothetical protein
MYAKISTVTPGPVLGRSETGGDPNPAKGFAWIPDNPPSYDPATQTRTQSASIPVDATEVPYTVADIPIATLRATWKAELAATRYGKEIGGIVLNGVPVGTDREDQAMVTGALVAFNAGAITEIKWKSPGGFVTLDATAFAAIAGAVAGHVQACFANEATLSAAIDAATTKPDLDSGWPS